MATILVADDDASITALVRTSLQTRGHTVYTCTTGSEAVTTLLTVRPHVVLLDVRMPVIDGAKVCAAVRSVPEGKALPIILMSSMDLDALRELAETAGADGILPKPFPLKKLIDLVDRYASTAPAPTASGPNDDAPPALDFSTDFLGGTLPQAIDLGLLDFDDEMEH